MKYTTFNDNHNVATDEKGPIWCSGRLYVRGDADETTKIAYFSWHFKQDACVGVTITTCSDEGCPIVLHFGVPYASFHLGIGSDSYSGLLHRLAAWWNRQSWGLDQSETTFESANYPGKTFNHVNSREYGVRIFAWALWLSFHLDPMDSRFGKSVTIHLKPAEWFWLRKFLTRKFDLAEFGPEKRLKLGAIHDDNAGWVPVFERRVEVPLLEGPVMGTFQRIRHSAAFVPSEWLEIDPFSTWKKRLKLQTTHPVGFFRRIAMSACDFIFAPPSWDRWTAEFDAPGLRHPGKGENSWDCGEAATSGMSFGTDTVFLHDAVGAAVALCLRDRYKNGGYGWRPVEAPEVVTEEETEEVKP